jgi:DNA-binding transcriptional regulator GbsR (MarR family)
MNDQQRFIEEFGLFAEAIGLPRMAGRILAWLLICDPPEQTMPDLTEALQASKSSISTMTRLLIQFRLVERTTLPGQRRDYYRVPPDFWERWLEDSVNKIAEFRKLAGRGLALLDHESTQRRRRLQDMHDVYLLLEEEYPRLVAQWKERRNYLISATVS